MRHEYSFQKACKSPDAESQGIRGHINPLFRPPLAARHQKAWVCKHKGVDKGLQITARWGLRNEVVQGVPRAQVLALSRDPDDAPPVRDIHPGAILNLPSHPERHECMRMQDLRLRVTWTMLTTMGSPTAVAVPEPGRGVAE